MPLNPRLVRADTTAASMTPPPSRRSRRFSLQPTTSLRPAVSPPRHSRSPSPKPKVPPPQPVKSTCKILIMGPSKAGKTSIIQRFLYNNFNLKYHRTVEELHNAEFAFNGSKLNLDILDTAGCYEFPAMRELNIASSDAFLLVYSIEEEMTFEEVAMLRTIVAKTKTDAVPLVIVANKSDKEDDDPDDTKFARISKKGEDLAKKWRHGFVKCSAKTGENITEVFKELLNQANVQYKLSPALRKRRQSLPGGVAGSGGPPQPVMVPTPAQLAALRERSKRNSCILS